MTLYVATAQQLDGVSGQYFSKVVKAFAPSSLAQNAQDGERLWQMSADLVGLNV